MRWTKERPSKPGWYWWGETRHQEMVYVSTAYVYRFVDDMMPIKFELDKMNAGLFYGPLTPPDDQAKEEG